MHAHALRLRRAGARAGWAEALPTEQQDGLRGEGSVLAVRFRFSCRDSLGLFALLGLHVPASKQSLRANLLELVTLGPSSCQT